MVKVLSKRLVSIKQEASPYYAELICDEASELPSPDHYKNWIIDMGSIAHVINSGETYMLNSEGNWIIQKKTDDAGAYTEEELNKLIGNKVAEAIAEVVSDAPDDLNTLREISDWIAGHEESAAAMNSAIKQNFTDISELKESQSAQDDKISANETAISEVAEQAALNRSSMGLQKKNLLKNACTSIIRNGITATVNEDGSVTLNGKNTASGTTMLYWNMQTGYNNGESSQYIDNKKWFPTGKYILSGGAAGAEVQICLAQSNDTSGVITSVYTTEKEIEITDEIKYAWTRIRIISGAEFNEVTLRPMLRLAEITDNTYEPCQPSLQEQINELKAQIEALKGTHMASTLLPENSIYVNEVPLKQREEVE